MQKLTKAAATLSLLGLAASGAHAQIVISQVYGGGGSTATSPVPSYKYDFIELYNNGTTTVNLAGYSVQYFSAAGTTPAGTSVLQGVIAAGDYYLVREGIASNFTGADIPTFNDMGTLALSGTNGKVGLASNSSPITFTTTAGVTTFSNTVDFVGYGSANAFEGAGAAPVLSTTTSTTRVRVAGLYQDTNNNSTDFAAAATPTPHVGAYTYVAPTPEPSGLVSMVLGAGALGLIAVRRRRTMNAA